MISGRIEVCINSLNIRIEMLWRLGSKIFYDYLTVPQKKCYEGLLFIIIQLIFTYPKSTIEILEKGAKYAQSYNKDTRTTPKLTFRTPWYAHLRVRRSGVFIVNFEQVNLSWEYFRDIIRERVENKFEPTLFDVLFQETRPNHKKIIPNKHTADENITGVDLSITPFS